VIVAYFCAQLYTVLNLTLYILRTNCKGRGEGERKWWLVVVVGGGVSELNGGAGTRERRASFRLSYGFQGG